MKLGILGGSFNPVHTGHVRMAIEVLERLGLDRVVLMPASVPPHKSGLDMLPFSERLRLVRLAVRGIPGLAASGLEGERPGPSYTYETLGRLCAERPGDELSFLMGVGTFLELGKWRNGLELPGLANLVCVNRWVSAVDRVAGFVSEYWPMAERLSSGDEPVWRYMSGNTLHYLEIPRLDIKGGDVRERWLRGRDISLLVPPGVAEELNRGGPVYEDAWGKRSKG